MMNEIRFSKNGLQTENGKADLITKSLFLDIDGIGKREVIIDQYSNGSTCVKTMSLLTLQYTKIEQLLKKREKGAKRGWNEQNEKELIESIQNLESSVTGLGETILGTETNALLWEMYGKDALRYTVIISSFYDAYYAPAVTELKEEWEQRVIQNNRKEKELFESYENELKKYDSPNQK